MTGTIFANPTLDRTATSWELHLADLTPVEDRDGIWYKREDYFAPLGYGGINGAKLRQLVWLANRHRDAPGLLTGASVLSPQVSMAALVARHFGQEAVVVLGATHRTAAIRHENVAIAAAAGADFIFTPVAYNPALQRAVNDIGSRPEFAGWWRLHYGITTPPAADPAEIAAFHAVGAGQVANVPAAVDTLTMTAGSCNTCVSVLYGIALRRPAGLRRVVLFGIGPTRLQWIEDRLEAIETATGVEARGLFRRRYHQHPELEAAHQTDGPYLLEHHDLHAAHVFTYQDRRPWTEDGIVFHPTYEGKALSYLAQHRQRFDWFWRRDGRTLFWIVGSEPSARAMRGRL